MEASTPLFSKLPDEIILAILSFLPSKCLPVVQRTSRRLQQLVDEPLLWQRLCQTEYRFWHPQHNISDKLAAPTSVTNWRALYMQRQLRDQEVVAKLGQIIASQQNRIVDIETILDKGYDAKDVLLQQFDGSDNEPDVLARYFYAKAALATIHRSVALEVWDRLRQNQHVDLEHALGAFDLFVMSSEGDGSNSITSRLDHLVQGFQQRYPEHDTFTARKKALYLVHYMREQQFTGVSEDDYAQLQNNFIGIALGSHNHHALPLIQVSIYCCLARRLGLDAHPCSFPMHIYGIIYPPKGKSLDGLDWPTSADQEFMYVDPFRTASEIPLSELQSILRQLGVPKVAEYPYLRPASTRELVQRTARNIMRSCQVLQNGNDLGTGRDTHLPIWYTTHPDLDDAFYASLWALLLLDAGPNPRGSGGSQARNHRDYLPYIASHFQTHYLWDLALVERFATPLFENMPEHSRLLEMQQALRESDRAPRPAIRRSPIGDTIKFKVGQMFRHRRYEYCGVITGWDPSCNMEESWIRQQGVDRLAKGRNQSFYHIMVDDKSVRYVAEENIVPLFDDPPESLLKLAGRHFKRWDGEQKMFVSNVRDEYPDD